MPSKAPPENGKAISHIKPPEIVRDDPNVDAVMSVIGSDGRLAMQAGSWSASSRWPGGATAPTR